MVAVRVLRIWMEPPLLTLSAWPPVEPMKKFPAAVSKLIPPMFWVVESMTMGLAAELPQVLAMGALKAATSGLVVPPLLSPGGVLLPQFRGSVHEPEDAEPPVQIWLAPRTTCKLSNAAIELARAVRRACAEWRKWARRERRIFMVWRANEWRDSNLRSTAPPWARFG